MLDKEIKSLIAEGRIIVTIHDGVYDVTSFLHTHPGGRLVLQHASGNDITEVFTEFHSSHVWSMLPLYKIGEVDASERTPKSELSLDRIDLRKKIRKNGWDRVQPWDLAWIVTRSMAWMAASVGFFHVQEIWPSVCVTLGSVCLGMFFQQMAFIGHDAGHQAITTNRTLDTWIGYAVGNLASGVSLAWWKSSHHVHHLVCNSVEHDPDIQHLPMLACSSPILSEPVPPSAYQSQTLTSWWDCTSLFYSSFHKRWMGIDGWSRAILSVQHLFFYPLMAVARFNLYFQSWYMLLTNKNHPERRGVELVCLGLHLLWHGTLICTYTSDIVTMLYVILLSHAVAGILHIQIVMSHFAMSVYPGLHIHHDQWTSTQLATTMNIDCPPWMDWFHGGLQFQIEHHLFPRMPRYHLRSISSLVEPFCKKHKLPYVSVGFLKGNVMVYQALQQAGHTAWYRTPSESIHLLSDALNARG